MLTPSLTKAEKLQFERLAAKCRLDLVTMIDRAQSGHVGGALSSLDLLLALYSFFPGDRVVVSHGHVSAALYSVLGNLGYIDLDAALNGFRKAGSPFEGHPNAALPGIEWGSGALGQGLSAGAGFALGSRLNHDRRHVWVMMGDGEQAKGQLAEARLFAAKYRLGGLTAIIDCNGLQASGPTKEILPQELCLKYLAAGWDVIQVDGHKIDRFLPVLAECRQAKKPTLILAKTVMGKGIPEIENDFHYHGKLLSPELVKSASARFAKMAAGVVLPKRKTVKKTVARPPLNVPAVTVVPPGQKADCRGAFGSALARLAEANPGRFAAFDCDLAESTKLDAFAKVSPKSFFECGIAEENASTMAAALSKCGIVAWHGDFGVFNLNETLGQLRIADFNHCPVKVAATHCGVDVGEDGKTHQAVDYIALAQSLHHFELLLPADANCCTHLVNYAAGTPCGTILAMGRSKLPVITKEDGTPFYGEKYRFTYGKMDRLRESQKAAGTLIVHGTLTSRALEVYETLKKQGVRINVYAVTTPLALDETALQAAARTGFVAVWEDHLAANGFGAIAATYYLEHGIACRFRRFGLTKIGISAPPDEQYRHQNIAPEDVVSCFFEATATPQH